MDSDAGAAGHDAEVGAAVASGAAADASAVALLQLMWLASPALPVGGFSYSEGLGAAVEVLLVHDEASAGRWLVDQIQLVLGRSELPLLANAISAWRRNDVPAIAALNAWCTATRETAELRQQTAQMGRSLALWLRNRPQDTAGAAQLAVLMALAPAPCWPIAYALAASQTTASVHQALLAHAFGWAENMVQAAVKAVPLGQNAGQRILGALVAAIPGVVETALATADDARQAYTPMLAILSAQHETQYSRLFRS